MMKVPRFVVCIAFVAFILLTGAGKGFTAPAVVAEQTTYDAGFVLEGKDISHEFILKNTGDKPLTFKIKPC